MQIQYFQPMVLEMLLTEICDFQSLASCQSHNTGRSKGNLTQGRTILRKSSWKGDPWDTRPERTHLRSGPHSHFQWRRWKKKLDSGKVIEASTHIRHGKKAGMHRPKNSGTKRAQTCWEERCSFVVRRVSRFASQNCVPPFPQWICRWSNGRDFKWQRRISLQNWATLEGAKETWYREERSWENHVEKEIPETLDLKEPERRPCKLPYGCIPTLLKMEFEGGESYWNFILKFHFKISFFQSCFLNDQYSSSFHLRGLITIPGFPSKKKWNSTGWFCPPCPPPL